MRWFNRAYREAYPKQAGIYLGNDDFFVWPQEIAAVYREKDVKVQRGREAVIETEPDGKQTLLSVKWPVTVKHQNCPGVAGFAIPIYGILEQLQRGEL
jgi:hypothetical protein